MLMIVTLVLSIKLVRNLLMVSSSGMKDTCFGRINCVCLIVR